MNKQTEATRKAFIWLLSALGKNPSYYTEMIEIYSDELISNGYTPEQCQKAFKKLWMSTDDNRRIPTIKTCLHFLREDKKVAAEKEKGNAPKVLDLKKMYLEKYGSEKFKAFIEKFKNSVKLPALNNYSELIDGYALGYLKMAKGNEDYSIQLALKDQKPKQ